MGVLAKGSSAKALPLDDEDEEAKTAVLNVNQAYAERLAYNKKREALHRLQELKKRGVVDSSDEEEDDDESSDDGFLPARTDARFYETLAKIKRKDPSIYSLETSFFDDKDEEDEIDTEQQVRSTHSSTRSRAHKPVYLKDALAKQLIEDGSEFDEDDSKTKQKGVVTYADEQQSYKNEFLRSAKLDDEGEDSDDGNGFLKLRRREQPQMLDDAAELTPYDKDIAQRLEEYFGKGENLDENDKFLKDYLLAKSWVDEDADKIPSYEDIVDNVIEDEEELAKQDRFESEYNFRFEEGADAQVMGHSRIVDDSVRRKDDSRKQKREKKKERQSGADFERREELKRLKNIKKKEILEKLKKIRTVAGAKDSDANLLQVEDLEEEFDPEEYDKKMREAFGDEYYGAEDADENFQANDMDDVEKPNFEEEDEILGLPKGLDEDIDKESGALAGFAAARQKAKKLTLGGLELDNRNVEGEDFDSDDLEDPELDDEVEEAEESAENAKHGVDHLLLSHNISKRKKKAKVSLREKLAFDKQLEEYYKLDYEDMVGDMPTRFKYRQVKPNMYGLSASEILAAEEKDLNQYVSLKKLAPYVTQEWKPKWRFQVSQKTRKKKARKVQILTQTADHTTGTPLTEGGDVKGLSNSQMQHDGPEQIVSGTEGSKRKKKRRKKGLSLSESRLIAYGKISLPSRKRKRR